MATVEKEAIWLRAFLSLYEKAAPVIRRIADPGRLASGELPVSPYTLVESTFTLKPILETSRRMLETKEQRLIDLKNEFEVVLSSSVKAAEAAARYMELRDRGVEDTAALNIVINYTVLAHEYFESVSRKLGDLDSRMDGLDVEKELKLLLSAEQPKEIGVKHHGSDRQKTVSKRDVVSPSVGVHAAVDKIAGGIEYGLDKLGDAILFPFDRIARATRISRNPKKRKG